MCYAVPERWYDSHCCSLVALAIQPFHLARCHSSLFPALNLQATVASFLQPSTCPGVAKSIQLASKSALLGVLLSTAPQAAAWRRKVTDPACFAVPACVDVNVISNSSHLILHSTQPEGACSPRGLLVCGIQRLSKNRGLNMVRAPLMVPSNVWLTAAAQPLPCERQLAAATSCDVVHK